MSTVAELVTQYETEHPDDIVTITPAVGQDPNPSSVPGWGLRQALIFKPVGDKRATLAKYPVWEKLADGEARIQGLNLDDPPAQTDLELLDELLTAQVEVLIAAETILHAAPFVESPYDTTRRVNVVWSDKSERIYLASLNSSKELVFERIDV